MRALSLSLGLAICGCASAQSGFPKTQYEAVALVDAEPGCSERIAFPEPLPRPPEMAGLCATGTGMPRFLSEMEIAAECASLFDLADEGYPINIRVKCVLDPRKPISASMLQITQAAMVRLHERAVAEKFMYAPADPRFPGEIRTNLKQDGSYFGGIALPNFAFDLPEKSNQKEN